MSPRPGRQILTAITRIRAALVYRAVIFSGRLYALRARQRRRADVTENPRELFDPLGARRTSDPNLLIPLGPVVENLTANRDPPSTSILKRFGCAGAWAREQARTAPREPGAPQPPPQLRSPPRRHASPQS